MAQSPPAAAEKFPWPIVLIVCVGTFLGPLGGVIVGVALPEMGKAFGVDLQSIKWVVLVYLLVTTFLLPVTGILGRRFGEARIFIAGFAVLAVGTTLCAVVPETTLACLIGARVVQAVGASMVFALFGGLLAQLVPPSRRGMAFGIAGATVAVALVVAPVLGGVVLELASWHYVFWVQVPVQLLALGLGLAFIPRGHEPEHQPFPWISTFFWLISVAGVTLVAEAFSKGMWIQYVYFTIAVTLAGLVGFYITERRQPLFDYTLFRIPAFAIGSLGLMLLNACVFIMMLFLPFFFEDYMGLSQRQMGMFLCLSPLFTLLVAPGAGRYSDRHGYRKPVVLSYIVALAGYALIAALGAHGHILWVAVGLSLLGVAGGLFNAPVMSAMMGGVTTAQRSQASSLGSLTRNVGFLLGTSLGSLAFGLFLYFAGGRELMLAARTEQLHTVVSPPHFFSALAGTTWLCAAAMFFGLVASLRFPEHLPPPAP